ncbi:hypothetical protein BDK51DRAFT_11168, partial [Blyttiomyces helicus]
DQHQRYKLLANARNRKLVSFFGDDPPIDIPVAEVDKQGLKAILQSKVPLSYFLYNLLEEYACENLFFYLEVEHYDSVSFVSPVEQQIAAKHIFDTYLNRNSHFEVNVDEKV